MDYWQARQRGFLVDPYERDLATLKQYGEGLYKVTLNRCVRTKGAILPYTKKNTVNDAKSDDNIRRAHSRVEELALCNPWVFFVTLTLSKDKFDRFNLKSFRTALSQWIRDYNKKHGLSVKYLLIPEKHKNGAWHMHGFLMGLPVEHLTPFTLDMKIPAYIRNQLKNGQAVYDWTAYANKFGYTVLEPIRNQKAAAHYVTKYITKDLQDSVSELGAHLFFASQGLQGKKELKRGSLARPDFAFDYEGEYCKTSWLSDISQEDAEALIISKNESSE